VTIGVGRDCTVCVHRRRAAIDEALAAGQAILRIAKQFKVGRMALTRHRDQHLQKDVQAAAAARQVSEVIARGASVLDRLEALDTRMAEIIDDAMLLEDKSAAVRAIREMRGLVELRAKLTGELKDGAGQVTVNITHNDFRTLQVGIVAALEPFPEAKAAVLQALAMPLIEG
jgi:hypothetical protein